ncbi:hypothetical protein SAMN04515674_104250 [Pseudarcicella hirudinis]|uniref:Uncharacterized protein n=1 Tax=Pseudarcicella hirudinis TaxID=1079859 RepID=A0A1I5RV67_9BACT|nr:hypothetical protein [Pseudarcicella hirudinis]SFP62131.1 hypothetical protein SAMN04515674_104250 [Pseudarcicella hirudinis]
MEKLHLLMDLYTDSLLISSWIIGAYYLVKYIKKGDSDNLNPIDLGSLKVGDTVYCIINGKGKVAHVFHKTYKVYIQFSHGRCYSFEYNSQIALYKHPVKVTRA